MKKTFLALSLAFTFMVSGCNVTLNDASKKAEDLWNNKISNFDASKAEKIIENLGLKKLGDVKLNFFTKNGENGLLLDIERVNNETSGLDFKNKMAVIFSLIGNIDYIEVKNGNKVTKYNKEQLFKDLKIDMDYINKSKDNLKNFIDKYIPKK